MKHTMTLTVSVLVVAGLLAIGLMPSLQAGDCSNATFVGDYMLSGGGSLVVEGVPQPLVTIGRLTADGQGRFTGGSTSSLNGQITRFTYAATYTINADCTGYYAGTDSLGRSFQGDLVFLPSGRRNIAIRTVEGQTITIAGERE